MPQVVVASQWKLIKKNTIGDPGYTFQALTPSIQFPAGCGCDANTSISANSLTLIVSVAEQGAQRIYLEPQDADEPKGDWSAFAVITPIENETLEAATETWQENVPLNELFELDFRLASANLKTYSVYGKEPKLRVVPQSPAC